MRSAAPARRSAPERAARASSLRQGQHDHTAHHQHRPQRHPRGDALHTSQHHGGEHQREQPYRYADDRRPDVHGDAERGDAQPDVYARLLHSAGRRGHREHGERGLHRHGLRVDGDVDRAIVADGYSRHTGVGVTQSVGSGGREKVLRLTFDADGNLAQWKRI